MRRLSTLRGVGFVLIALGTPVFSAVARSGEIDAREHPPKLVRTARVELRAPSRELAFPGVTRAIQRAVLSFSAPGRLVERRAALGQRVSEGDVLARVDPAPLENAVSEASAALQSANVNARRAKRERERTENLLRVGGNTPRQLEDALAAEEASRAMVLAAESRLREARRLLKEATLRAPFSGTVSELFLQPGEHAHAGDAVLVISGDSGFEVEFQVPETVVRRIQMGMPVHVRFPMSGQAPMASHVTSVTYVGGAAGALFPVIATLEEPQRLMAGMSAEVIVEIRDEPSLLLPVAAIVNSAGGRPAVFRVRNGTARRIEIEIVELSGDRVIVRGALDADDEIIVAGHTALLDGDRIDLGVLAAPAPE